MYVHKIHNIYLCIRMHVYKNMKKTSILHKKPGCNKYFLSLTYFQRLKCVVVPPPPYIPKKEV